MADMRKITEYIIYYVPLQPLYKLLFLCYNNISEFKEAGRESKAMSDLIVIFPGIRYGADCPLLYYATLEYKRRGYTVVNVDYKVTSSPSLEEYLSEAIIGAKESLKSVDFSEYEDIIFASKSVGTAVALKVQDELKLPRIRHILLTPISLTLPLMQKERVYKCIVSSRADSYIDGAELEKIAREKDLPLTMFDCLGHRLESDGDAIENLKILENIVKLY